MAPAYNRNYTVVTLWERRQKQLLENVGMREGGERRESERERKIRNREKYEGVCLLSVLLNLIREFVSIIIIILFQLLP